MSIGAVVSMIAYATVAPLTRVMDERKVTLAFKKTWFLFQMIKGILLFNLHKEFGLQLKGS